MEQAHPQIREYLLPQLFGVGCGGLALVGDVVLLAHQRAYDEYLMPRLHLLADKLVHPLAVALAHGEGVHLLPPRGQLVHHRHIQVAVNNQRQRPWNGRGGQHQHVGIFRLLPQGRPLVHPEAVLLVGNHQPQPGVRHILRQQGVGADAQINAPQSQIFQNIPPLPGLGGPGEQGAPEPEFFKQRREIFIVLPGQNFRRGHQGRLPSALGGEPHAPRRHHGLAAAHIPLAQPVHGPPGSHVRHRLRNGPALGVCKGEGEGPVKFLHIRRGAGRPRHIRAPGAEHLQPAGEDEQLLKHHPPPGQVQRLRVRRKVDILVGISAVAEAMRLPHRVRQTVRQQVAAGRKPLAHGLI